MINYEEILNKRIVKFPEDISVGMTDEAIKRNVVKCMKQAVEAALPQILKIVANEAEVESETGYINKKSITSLESEILKELCGSTSFSETDSFNSNSVEKITKHPELKEGETFLMNVTKKEFEVHNKNLPTFIKSIRLGDVAYTTNFEEVVKSIKEFRPMFGVLKNVEEIKFRCNNPGCIQCGENNNSTELERVIDEKEALINAFDKIRKAFEGREWLMDGRGAYPYDDERYKEEVKYLMNEFKSINTDVWRQIKSKTFEYKDKLKKGLFDKETMDMLLTINDNMEDLTDLADGYEEDYSSFNDWLDKIKNL